MMAGALAELARWQGTLAWSASSVMCLVQALLGLHP
jgi:hypothetical protein